MIAADGSRSAPSFYLLAASLRPLGSTAKHSRYEHLHGLHDRRFGQPAIVVYVALALCQMDCSQLPAGTPIGMPLPLDWVRVVHAVK